MIIVSLIKYKLFHQHFFALTDVYIALLGMGYFSAFKVVICTFVCPIHFDRLYALGRGQFHNAALEDLCRPAFCNISGSLAVRHSQYALRGDVLEGIIAEGVGLLYEAGHGVQCSAALKG